jgi:hypothetical protein
MGCIAKKLDPIQKELEEINANLLSLSEQHHHHGHHGAGHAVQYLIITRKNLHDLAAVVNSYLSDRTTNWHLSGEWKPIVAAGKTEYAQALMRLLNSESSCNILPDKNAPIGKGCT